MNTILEYLTDLEKNNNREWYHANKERLHQANTEFEHLLGELIAAIGDFDSSVIHNNPKDITTQRNTMQSLNIGHKKRGQGQIESVSCN